MEATNAKIIVALVEGPNDQVGLTKLLEYLVRRRYSDREIKLAVVGTDLLQHEPPIGVTGILQLVIDQVQNFLSLNKLAPENLVEVIEIADVDGVYLADALLQPQLGPICYQDHAILCSDVEKIKKRNALKRTNIASLIKEHYLALGSKPLPYSLYYFSCNFEDVFFGARNNDKLTKHHFALTLDKEFMRDPASFFEKHFTKDIFPFDAYGPSWDALGRETTRIPRWSNLNTWMPEQINPLIVP
jgi:hypothetical protein